MKRLIAPLMILVTSSAFSGTFDEHHTENTLRRNSKLPRLNSESEINTEQHFSSRTKSDQKKRQVNDQLNKNTSYQKQIKGADLRLNTHIHRSIDSDLKSPDSGFVSLSEGDPFSPLTDSRSSLDDRNILVANTIDVIALSQSKTSSLNTDSENSESENNRKYSSFSTKAFFENVLPASEPAALETKKDVPVRGANSNPSTCDTRERHEDSISQSKKTLLNIRSIKSPESAKLNFSKPKHKNHIDNTPPISSRTRSRKNELQALNDEKSDELKKTNSIKTKEETITANSTTDLNTDKETGDNLNLFTEIDNKTKVFFSNHLTKRLAIIKNEQGEDINDLDNLKLDSLPDLNDIASSIHTINTLSPNTTDHKKTKKRRRIATSARLSQQMKARNTRERVRAQTISNAIKSLERIIPNNKGKKLSKLDTLINAMKYMIYLKEVLEEQEEEIHAINSINDISTLIEQKNTQASLTEISHVKPLDISDFHNTCDKP